MVNCEGDKLACSSEDDLPMTLSLWLRPLIASSSEGYIIAATSSALQKKAAAERKRSNYRKKMKQKAHWPRNAQTQSCGEVLTVFYV